MIDTTKLPKSLRTPAGFVNGAILAAAFWIVTGVTIALIA